MRLGPCGSIRRAGRAGDPEVRFHLQGEFDIANKHLLANALRAGMASSIVGVLIELANGKQARLRIANSSGHLQLLFSICRLDETLVMQ